MKLQKQKIEGWTFTLLHIIKINNDEKLNYDIATISISLCCLFLQGLLKSVKS